MQNDNDRIVDRELQPFTTSTDFSLAFVIAHFNPRGRLTTNLFNLVRHVATLTKRVVFVSTGISSQEVRRLEPYAKVIVRENIGYDFWSYKVGIDALGERIGLQRLILFNSSFLTTDPLLLCNEFLAPVEGPALRGITICKLPQLHVQSYWLSFEHDSLINSADFSRWWGKMVPISDREEVIARYEIGLSAWFLALGVPLKAAFMPTTEDLLIALCRAIGGRLLKVDNISSFEQSDPSFNLEISENFNHTHFLWDSLFKRFSILKIELLKKNPMQLSLVPLYNQINADPALHELVRDGLVD